MIERPILINKEDLDEYFNVVAKGSWEKLCATTGSGTRSSKKDAEYDAYIDAVRQARSFGADLLYFRGSKTQEIATRRLGLFRRKYTYVCDMQAECYRLRRGKF